MRRKKPPRLGLGPPATSDDEANADLSAQIVAKARARGTSAVDPVIIDSDADDVSAKNVNSLEITAKKQRREPKKTKKASKVTNKENDILKNRNIYEDKSVIVVDDKALNTVDTFKQGADALFKAIPDDGEDNLEMRKLLRGPRYFDLPEEKTCFRCGISGHVAAECHEEAPKRACFVCGSVEHEARSCPQGSCFICKGVGHFAKSCPNKGSVKGKHSEVSKVCIRCGNVGHDMVGCFRNYHPEDLKVIQCYVCKQYGHLCCLDVVVSSDRQVSCYNCGEIGHNGMGCAKSRNDTASDKKPAKVCYKCGEEGHFARGCSMQDKGQENEVSSDHSSHRKRKQRENKFQGLTSVPTSSAKESRTPQAISFGHPRNTVTDSYWIGGSMKEQPALSPPVPSWPEHWRMVNGNGPFLDRLRSEAHSYSRYSHSRIAGFYDRFDFRPPRTDFKAPKRWLDEECELRSPKSDTKVLKRKHYHHKHQKSDGKWGRY